MPSAEKNPDISPIASYILDEDITALTKALDEGVDFNKAIRISQWSEDLPIWHAVFNKKLNVIRWLISKKVKLNDKKHPVIIAGVYAGKEMLKLLLSHGANINAHDHIARNVITIALYEKKLDLIPFLIECGFDPKRDGRSLRQAVFGRQFKAVKMLLDLGFDPNFRERDQVHPENPSAVHVAARNKNDFKTVQLLLEYGADIQIKDNYGDRPFTAAMLNNDKPLMAYLKAVEPAEWHDETLHLASLAQYQIPQSLLDICKRSSPSKRKIDFKSPGEYGVRYIVLHPVLLLKAAQFRKKEFVEFVGETDNYDNFLVWYPAKHCLAYMDLEHDEFKTLGTWEDFLTNPDTFFAKYLSDYF